MGWKQWDRDMGQWDRVRQGLPLLWLCLLFFWAGAQAQPLVTFGGSGYYPPFHYQDAGQARGYDVEVFRAIARELSWTPDFQFGQWQDIQEALAAGEIDLVPMFVSESRRQRFLFSEPFRVEHHVLVGRQENASVSELSELSRQRIATENGSYVSQQLRLLGLDVDIVAAGSEAEALRLAASGQAAMAFVPAHVARYLIETEGLVSLVALSPPLLPVTYAFALAPGHSALMSEVNTALERLQRRGELERLHSQWLDILQPLSVRDRLRLSLWIVLPLILLLMAASLLSWLYFSAARRLSRELNGRQRLLFTLQKHVKELASKDPLTDLPNRERFEHSLQKRLDYLSGSAHFVAVAVLSFRDHASIRARYGDALADALVQDLSSLVKLNHKGLLGAQSGGRLLLVQEGIVSADNAIAWINRLTARARPHLTVKGELLDLPLSVGLSFFPEHGVEASELVRKAGLTLQCAQDSLVPLMLYREALEEKEETRRVLV